MILKSAICLTLALGVAVQPVFAQDDRPCQQVALTLDKVVEIPAAFEEDGMRSLMVLMAVTTNARKASGHAQMGEWPADVVESIDAIAERAGGLAQNDPVERTAAEAALLLAEAAKVAEFAAPVCVSITGTPQD